MRKILLILVVLIVSTAAKAQLASAIFNKNMPQGWNFVSYNEARTEPEWYASGALKMRFENIGVATSQFAAADGSLVVEINIDQMNANEKIASSGHTFMIYGIDIMGDTIAESYIDCVAPGKYSALLPGAGVVRVVVLLHSFPQASGVVYNVGLASVEVSRQGAPAGTNDPSNPSWYAYVANHNLFITGLDEGAKIEVFSITGAKVFETRARENVTQISGLRGIYIVRSGGRTFKVTVK